MPLNLFNEFDIRKTLLESLDKKGKPHLVDKALDYFNYKFEDIIDDVISYVIEFEFCNESLLKVGQQVLFQGKMWEVIQVGPGRAVLQQVGTEKYIDVSRTAALPILYDPEEDKEEKNDENN